MYEKLLVAYIALTQSRNERGATATEYALLVGLIALAIVAGVFAFGGSLNSFFNGLVTKLNAWATGKTA